VQEDSRETVGMANADDNHCRKGFGSQPDDLAVDHGGAGPSSAVGRRLDLRQRKGWTGRRQWSGVDHLNAPGTWSALPCRCSARRL